MEPCEISASSGIPEYFPTDPSWVYRLRVQVVFLLFYANYASMPPVKMVIFS